MCSGSLHPMGCDTTVRVLLQCTKISRVHCPIIGACTCASLLGVSIQVCGNSSCAIFSINRETIGPFTHLYVQCYKYNKSCLTREIVHSKLSLAPRRRVRQVYCSRDISPILRIPERVDKAKFAIEYPILITNRENKQ